MKASKKEAAELSKMMTDFLAEEATLFSDNETKRDEIQAIIDTDINNIYHAFNLWLEIDISNMKIINLQSKLIKALTNNIKIGFF